MATLEEENRQVLNLIQSLLGAVSSNFRAVSITVDNEIILHFLLEKDNAEDREEIEDIEFEFLAMQGRLVTVTTEIVVSSRPIDEIRLPGRGVFLRRESLDHASN
ncbi:MAG: hypothetical protein IPM54_12955 [Polyangiaceae bacterium]|nr:hypothetical protein [Polyangiaceae bacterium]